MKKIAARVLSLKTRLFGRMSRIKSVRHLALSIRLGVYGDVLTPTNDSMLSHCGPKAQQNPHTFANQKRPSALALSQSDASLVLFQLAASF